MVSRVGGRGVGWLGIKEDLVITFSLQSGSNGNSICVEAGDVRLLFDAGISGKQAEGRMGGHGREIRELLYFEPQGTGTDVGMALQYLDRVMHRKSVVFVVSDFIADDIEHDFRIAKRRHDLIPITITDPREMEMPDVGFVELVDAETGQAVIVDTSSRSFRDNYGRHATENESRLTTLFRKMDADAIQVRTDESFVGPLTRFFRAREARL